MLAGVEITIVSRALVREDDTVVARETCGGLISEILGPDTED